MDRKHSSTVKATQEKTKHCDEIEKECMICKKHISDCKCVKVEKKHHKVEKEIILCVETTESGSDKKEKPRREKSPVRTDKKEKLCHEKTPTDSDTDCHRRHRRDPSPVKSDQCEEIDNITKVVYIEKDCQICNKKSH